VALFQSSLDIRQFLYTAGHYCTCALILPILTKQKVGVAHILTMCPVRTE